MLKFVYTRSLKSESDKIVIDKQAWDKKDIWVCSEQLHK